MSSQTDLQTASRSFLTFRLLAACQSLPSDVFLQRRTDVKNLFSKIVDKKADKVTDRVNPESRNQKPRIQSKLREECIMPTTRLHRYQSLRSTGRRRKVFDKVFKEYKSILGGRTKELLYHMAVILDAAIALNRVTRAKRQCSIEKQALNIYHDFLQRVSKILKDLQKFHRLDQLEWTEEVLKSFNDKCDQVRENRQMLLHEHGLTMGNKGTMYQTAKKDVITLS